jgi:hypothetical protein
MSNPTTPFSWQMPQSTDLVTDLPADFEVFGQAVATSMADLLGGTTGQILTKNSNADMDFVWSSEAGDISAVTVSSPITGGGTSGSVNIAIQDGTTSQKGAVQLENSVSSTSTTTAAVPANVKTAYDLAAAASPKLLSFNAQTGTTYTLVSGDADKLVTTSNASAVTVTIPPSVFSAGQVINLQSIGVGLTTFAAGAGVTITSTGASSAAPVLRARYSACVVICTASNVFTVIGDIS